MGDETHGHDEGEEEEFGRGVLVCWVGGGGDLGVHVVQDWELEVDVLKRVVVAVVVTVLVDKRLQVELNLRQKANGDDELEKCCW